MIDAKILDKQTRSANILHDSALIERLSTPEHFDSGIVECHCCGSRNVVKIHGLNEGKYHCCECNNEWWDNVGQERRRAS